MGVASGVAVREAARQHVFEMQHPSGPWSSSLNGVLRCVGGCAGS